MGRQKERPAEFERMLEEAKALIARGERIEYGDAELFLVGEETMRTLVRFDEKARELLPPYKTMHLGGTVKLLNPDAPAVRYHLFTRKTPRIISDKEKALEAAEREFAVWANVVRKGLKEEILAGAYSEEEAARMTEETERRIGAERRELDEVLRHPERFDIRITNYETARAYPCVSLVFPDRSRRNEHLSIERPNVLWHRREEEGPRHRRDASIREVVRRYRRIGGTIYVKEENDG